MQPELKQGQAWKRTNGEMHLILWVDPEEKDVYTLLRSGASMQSGMFPIYDFLKEFNQVN